MDAYKEIDVRNATLRYFNGDELATDVWIKKYCLKDDENYYELSPDDMHRRIAKEIARIEKKYRNPISEEIIYETIKNFERIIPQGSPMSGIGNDFQIVSLSNCFVIGNNPDSDSYGGIMKLDQEIVQLEKRRGGVGVDMSFIRPHGSPVKNSAITSTGVVPFMERFSNSTKEVAQDGRRGALMISISINHPDSEKFIDAKLTQGKVTGANVSVKLTDEFMYAAINGLPYTQKYPINSPNPKFTKDIDAQKLWKKIIHNAWKSAEPGILFWDTIMKESIPDCYSQEGFTTVSTNPCIVGDTLIATADGRNSVSIKQLAEENKDIPVYCLDDKGKLCVRTMRNPRITGYNQKIYKITLENGHEIRTTGNHKIRLSNDEYVEAKNLKYGDSIDILTKWLSPVVYDEKKSKKDYMWLHDGNSVISEHRFLYEQYNNDKIKKSYVIHHKDHNSLNNSIDNLELMSNEYHYKLHSKDMIGGKNPYFRMTKEWKSKFASHKGEKNHKFNFEVSNDDVRQHALELTNKIKRRFSINDWIEYAKENNLPQSFSEFRGGHLINVISLSKWASSKLGIEMIDIDPRLVKTYKTSIENGYKTKIENNHVIVEKICENCGEKFWVKYFRREKAFCSTECSISHLNSNEELNKFRIQSINEKYKNKSSINKNKQLNVYSKLKFELSRQPLLIEWKNRCKKLSIPYRFKTKYGFSSFSDLKKESEFYNHRILSVEIDGNEDVYNGTVDEFHNFFSGGFIEKTTSEKDRYLYINQLNCGEIPLCPNDSCRLLALNLFGYVKNPFTPDAIFDWELFRKDVMLAMRYMDDIIDLEIEKIENIISKIKSDPENESIKSCEINLWNNIKEMTIKGRRTGLGVTAEGDMLASLGFRYGTDEATLFSVEVHKTLKLSAYRSSVTMASERGVFPIYNAQREAENPFIQRIIDEDLELYMDMVKSGRRNIALLTIAPTGTSSIMTQTTSGIEPVFLPIYQRRRKINPQEKNVRIDFVDDDGIAWMEYPVFHHKFEMWLVINGYNIDEVKLMTKFQLDDIVKKSPYYKATSNDVDWVKKVEMQGRIQKHVDHSISVTVNLPKDTTEDVVAEVYKTGWSSGCKGITVYRDGSRSGVLIGVEEKKEETFHENHAPKRPKKLKGEIHRFQNSLEKWIAVVGLKDGHPYEIFTGKLENGLSTLPPYVKECDVVKVVLEGENGERIKRYDIEYVDADGIQHVHQGLNHAFNPEFWNYAKFISGVLRHGMPIIYVHELINSLNFKEDYINTWKNGVARVIKKYIKDGEKGRGKCPECGSDQLEYKEGCLTCAKCGNSKCS